MWLGPGSKKKGLHFQKDQDHILDAKQNPEFFGEGLHSLSAFYFQIC